MTRPCSDPDHPRYSDQAEGERWETRELGRDDEWSRCAECGCERLADSPELGSDDQAELVALGLQLLQEVRG